ncbi:MAG: FkbM family methyltransferase [Acidobacteriota bacterium]|nr:FkbM family methyltransferase [Acidobacteriota bacterium]
MVEQRLGGLLGRVHRVVSTLAGGARRRHSPLRRRLSPIYGHLLHALSAGRGVRAEINGEAFRLDPRFRGFMQPDYEADLARMLRARMTAGQCCLDIGAHVGIYALQIARWTAPGGRLIAFEPNPGTAGVLRRHLRMNRLDHAVQVEEIALGARAGTSMLFGESGSGLSRLAAPNPEAPAAAGARAVAVSTVDAYCRTHALQPDWLLIDVEGFEFDVLAGATETIRARGRSLSIVLEIHPTLWPLTGWTASSAHALFASLGRRPVPLVGQLNALADYGSIELTPTA